METKVDKLRAQLERQEKKDRILESVNRTLKELIANKDAHEVSLTNAENVVLALKKELKDIYVDIKIVVSDGRAYSGRTYKHFDYIPNYAIAERYIAMYCKEENVSKKTSVVVRDGKMYYTVNHFTPEVLYRKYSDNYIVLNSDGKCRASGTYSNRGRYKYSTVARYIREAIQYDRRKNSRELGDRLRLKKAIHEFRSNLNHTHIKSICIDIEKRYRSSPRALFNIKYVNGSYVNGEISSHGKVYIKEYNDANYSIPEDGMQLIDYISTGNN